MAHSLSAKKRIRQNAKRRQRNKSRKSAMRSAMKKVIAACDQGDPDTAQTLVPRAMSLIDKAAKNCAIHARTAARRKARLARLINRTAKPQAAE
jgi:small subunit ribosomal protein S20